MKYRITVVAILLVLVSILLVVPLNTFANLPKGQDIVTAVPGTWMLFFDWVCDGTYSRSPITLNSDGTFTTRDGYSGLWVQEAGMIEFTFNDTDTTYAGNVASKSITGIGTTFAGLNGCFYMLQVVVPYPPMATATATAEGELQRWDSAGNPVRNDK